MKQQTKPFIVEIKSSRRDSKKEAKSIWGDIDLSAAEDAIDAKPSQPIPPKPSDK